MPEPNIGDIRNQLVNIQLSLTRTLGMIDNILNADGCAEEMEDDMPEDDEVDDRAQIGSVMGYTDKSIWLCPRCVTVITNLEYRHLNLNGCCEECETRLEQYEKVEWRA